MEEKLVKEPKLEIVVDELWSEASSLRSGIDRAIGARHDRVKIRRLLDLVEAKIGQLVSLREDLEALSEMEHPVVAIEIEEEPGGHQCDACIVITQKLDPNEHCHGCTNEASLQHYIPPHLRRGYVEPTEASTEQDEK